VWFRTTVLTTALSAQISTVSGPEGPLHVAGRAELLRAPRSVAIVGARAASGQAMVLAQALGHDLTRAGSLVMSGGAVGIDAAAHRGALAAGGPTVAVVAGGPTRPYPPRNASLFAEILGAGGAVASPFPDDEPLRRWHFVKRNAALASLAGAVIVVQASARSGSRHTVAAARAAGRLIGACAGSPGTDALLREGAALIASADDVLAALDGRPRRHEVTPPASGDALLLWSTLDAVVPRSPEELAARAGLTPRQVTAGLVALELEGLALPAPGGYYVRLGGTGSV
jgi:DNA processing protein